MNRSTPGLPVHYQLRIHPNPCPLSRWCNPTISSSVVPFSSRLQSFPASGSFPMSQLFAWDGQSIGVSASASVFPMNTQDWSPLGWTSWISLLSNGLSRVFFNTTVQSISSSKDHPGLISFRMDWLDLLAVQGTLKSLLQHHRSKASILQCSAFFIVYPYMTTGKTIALTRWTFVDKVISLLLNMLSRLVITFLPRSKCLLI